MNLKKALYRSTNKALAHLGLELSRKRQDFDARVEQDFSRSKIFSALGEVIDEWLASQTIFERQCEFSGADLVAAMYEKFLASPFRRRGGGSRFNNLCWLAAIAKSMQPSLIVDSGTFQGASAWAFSCAEVSCKIISFDIDLSRLLLCIPDVEYREHDWTWESLLVSENSLVYFDDHLDQIRRLIEASQFGFKVAIFDDDFPLTSFSEYANGGESLPKIEFALDTSLRSQEKITWSQEGKTYDFRIDREYLDRGLALIENTDRLPNTSLITGIHQTPYRVVKIRKDQACNTTRVSL